MPTFRRIGHGTVHVIGSGASRHSSFSEAITGQPLPRQAFAVKLGRPPFFRLGGSGARAPASTGMSYGASTRLRLGPRCCERWVEQSTWPGSFPLSAIAAIQSRWAFSMHWPTLQISGWRPRGVQQFGW